MKEDITFPAVDRVGVCAIPSIDDEIRTWTVHIINMLDTDISNVLISTRGYGRRDDEEVSTSELRHYFEKIESQSTRQVEVITDELKGLNNQYWVSFYIDRTIYDKKFIFLPDTLLEKNLVDVPVIGERGILIL